MRIFLFLTILLSIFAFSSIYSMLEIPQMCTIEPQGINYGLLAWIFITGAIGSFILYLVFEKPFRDLLNETGVKK